jgi:hypothetical protein
VNIEWSNGSGCAELTSDAERTVRVSVSKGAIIEVKLIPGKTTVLKWNGDAIISEA